MDEHNTHTVCCLFVGVVACHPHRLRHPCQLMSSASLIVNELPYVAHNQEN